VVVDIVIPEAEYSQAEGGMWGRTSSAPFGGTFPTGGRLDGVEALLNRLVNGGTDAVEVTFDIVIPEAEYSQAEGGKVVIPISVALFRLRFIVLGAIQFHNELCRCAVEIHDVMAELPLPVEGDGIGF